MSIILEVTVPLIAADIVQIELDQVEIVSLTASGIIYSLDGNPPFTMTLSSVTTSLIIFSLPSPAS